MKKVRAVLPVLLVLAAGIVLGIRQVKPPRADESSPAFRRMTDNIRSLAAAPHPAGSPEIGIVREKLLAAIAEAGGKESYTVEDASYTDADSGLSLHNLFVKLDAPDTDRGVLFAAHYDSTAGGPGAADDMLSVCALVEAIRAEAGNDSLRNDLYFLFTDGEEAGMLGARAFVATHDLRDRIDLVVNLEARGNRGGLLLFETSPHAHAILHTVVRAGAKPIGFSWAAAIYALMPNHTDLTEFLERGYRGGNFAAVEGVQTYHRPTDNFENLDRATAGQYLNTALALADYAGGHSLDALRHPSAEAVYFPLLPGFLVLMTSGISAVLCVLACALAVVWGIVQIRRRRLRPSFSVILTGLLLLLSVGSALFFAAGSYLFYIPLLLTVLTMSLQCRKCLHVAAKAVSGVTVLLLWVPVLFLLWVSVVQPAML